jgi:nucleotide-binding universal stress UspA family protein
MESIVVGVDGSEWSHDALRWAVDEARRRQAAVQAVFAWTFPYAVPVVGHPSDPEWLQREAEKHLEALLRQELGEALDVEVTSRVKEGPAARVLLDAARRASLLVVGSRGRGGFAGLVLGSVSQHCAQHARCPVVVVRRDDLADSAVAEEKARARVVVGVDGSEAARAAVDWALEEARLREAPVDVVHAWQPPYMNTYPFIVDFHSAEFERNAQNLLYDTVGAIDSTGIPAVEPVLVCDSPARALLDTAKGADLLVVGCRGRGGFAGMLLGSVSQKVLHHAPCPVVVIPPGTG